MLLGTVVSECFSQNKDELVIRFETHNGSFYVKTNLSPQLSTLSFPREFHRARKNSVDLFPELIGHHVTSIQQSENERSFILHLTEEKAVLFKMHGNRSNILLFKAHELIDSFRKNLDANTTLENLDRDIDWSFDTFMRHLNNLPALYFTFGKPIWRYVESLGFLSMTPEQRWKTILDVRARLEKPEYYISRLQEKVALMLVPYGEILKSVRDPVVAANEFYHTFTQTNTLDREKIALIQLIDTRLKAGTNYIEKNASKLAEIESDNSYRVWADLIMANLHAIQSNSKTVVLENFYDDNKPVAIKLKPESSPQKTAETFYRKAKNQQIEIDQLRQSINAKKNELQHLTTQKQLVGQSNDITTIRSIAQQLKPVLKEKQAAPLPYHEFIFNGFKIWVGKSAEANDILTLKLGFKEDLWLHAKDVAGSHVLIKYQSGKKFPKDVIERAAELAAYNSKRKTETLAPVIFTPKKYVRKRKGDPAGMVVVEREDVIMVVPRLNQP